MAQELLIIVDYQADFVADDGVLTAGKPAQDLDSWLSARAQSYLAKGQHIVFTYDTHDRNRWSRHPESAAFPIHCVKGTSGWEIYGRTASYVGCENVQRIEKSAYCPSFDHLESWVREYDRIEIAGVATDICVLHTAVGLYTAKVEASSEVKLIVWEEGCASFNPEGHAFAMKHMLGTLGMHD